MKSIYSKIKRLEVTRRSKVGNYFYCQALNAELIRLDRYFDNINTRFLAADHLTHLDCYILPKLHTIRIALGALKGYEIPSNLHNLWSYMKSGYAMESFRKSCPSDQVIAFFLRHSI